MVLAGVHGWAERYDAKLLSSDIDCEAREGQYIALSHCPVVQLVSKVFDIIVIVREVRSRQRPFYIAHVIVWGYHHEDLELNLSVMLWTLFY